ncbi:hypothetical protein [Microbacterium aoyamense]|uniref:hypothetical protein n=1 Tax=Microbacterium aoyamense TaxID=344166 RepID=UPI00200559EF|nr:hypothetical protein [Microbacterium aoyamense]
MPFQVGSVLLAVVLGWVGLATQPWLAVLLAVALWAPAAAELLLRTTIPWALQLHYILFMIGGPFAGSALNLYGALPVWDGLIHFDSGVMLAWLGMLLVRRAEESADAPLPHWFSLTVILFTPMAFAAAWEICEFASDILIGTVSQSGLEDTMRDIVAGTLGGMLAIALLVLFRRPRTLAPESLLTRRADIRET